MSLLTLIARPRRVALAVALSGPLAMGTMADASAETTVNWLHLQNNPQILDVWNKQIDAYEKDHPDTKVETQFLENEAFKAKLPTLLQSSDAPDMFYSWAGGVLHAQADAGALRPFGDMMTGDWKKRLNPASLDAFRYDDKIWGAPYALSVVDFYYNKTLFDKAGVDAGSIKTWGDFLDAVKKLKDAGITPISVGGGDKWPVHFYWVYLAIRLGGQEAFQQATSGDGKGFESDVYVKAGKLLKQLADVEPFQKGYLGANYNSMLGQFGDGKAAMILGFSGTYGYQANAAADGKGLAESNIGMMPFPMVDGGKGEPTDTMGGINGWIMSRNASDETIDFLDFLTNVKNQKEIAATGILLPAVTEANEAIEDPLLKQAAEQLAKSTYHQNFYDQDLGPDVGRVVNDQTTDIVSGAVSPEEAAGNIQAAWELNQ